MGIGSGLVCYWQTGSYLSVADALLKRFQIWGYGYKYSHDCVAVI